MLFLPIDVLVDPRNIVESSQPQPFMVRFGPPGHPTISVFSKDNQPRVGWICRLTNYADVPLFNIHLAFQVRFVEVIENTAKPENTVATKTMVMEIPSIDPKESFLFYVKNDGRYFAETKIAAQGNCSIVGWKSHRH
jgi:hypothetical protein